MAEPKPGDMIEGFRILQEIGRGAASVIYLVMEPKTKQVWALKHVEKKESQDTRFLDQAENEAKISTKLDHPAIRKVIKVLKNGYFKPTELYLVMEWCDGTSIDRSPPGSMAEAAHIFHQAAVALHHMHERGVVHADIKPNNILVNDDGHAFVIDLGQSCPIGTIKRRIQGTPDYIAPEQVHRREITPKTDIYNLGATMYWTFTHKNIPTALAKGDSLVGSLDDNLIEKPKPVVELNPSVEPRLSELIMQCVEVDPEKRPADMKYVADRLHLIYALLKAKSSGPPADGEAVA